MLSVLHISFWDNVGGSGRAAYRLHTGLRQLGVRSRMLVALKATDDPDVRVIGGRVLGRLDRWCGGLVDRFDFQYLFYPSSWLLPRFRWIREATIVQVFNTHGGYFAHRALARLSRARPVVWRLSDMWAMTGHCDYSYECDRWKTGCGSCPHLDEFPALRRDRTAQLWNIKNDIYARSRVTLVAPSRWLAGLTRESPLLRRFPVRVIPNGIDTDLFRPAAAAEARAALGIAPDGFVVMFSAASVSDERKGGRFLNEALAQLAPALRRRITLLILGRDSESWPAPEGCEVRRLGAVGADRMLARAYAAADVFVLPTLAENLPNTALESMACGTPVVAFRVGGVPEAVRHMETGFLAEPRDASGLAQGIRLLLEDSSLREGMARRARQVAEEDYGLMKQARAFLDLYRSLAPDATVG